jgi:hypothetical protein
MANNMNGGSRGGIGLGVNEMPHAIPNSITIQFFSNGSKEILSTFVKRLSAQGVANDKINSVLSEMAPDIQRIVTSSNKLLQAAVTDYIYRRDIEQVRFDYLGRALVHNIENFFPRHPALAEKLCSEPVPGHLPVQVAEGLINALKSAHGADTVKEYEGICDKRAELYRNKADLLINADNFINDQEVKSLTREILTRFRLVLHKKSKDEQKNWIYRQISSSVSFREMTRDLADEELTVITHAYLNID